MNTVTVSYDTVRLMTDVLVTKMFQRKK